jgi:pimeloyl-ACP methyl ester carboxylesterase
VALAAAALLHARGVFLMAPAIYFDGLPPRRPRPLDCPATIVHGWQDEVVPFDHSVRFGREHGVTLHLINADHRMHGQLRMIQQLFEHFIIALDMPGSG